MKLCTASLNSTMRPGLRLLALETLFQDRLLNVFFDTTIVACASESTLGGKVAKFNLLSKLQNDPNRKGNGDPAAESLKARRITGMYYFANTPKGPQKLVLDIARVRWPGGELCQRTSNLTDIHLDEPLNRGNPEYMGQRTKDALNVVMATESVLLDPVYTGKAIG